MPPTLHIDLLGDFRVRLDREPVTGVGSARLRSLIAYLVLHREAPQPRQRLAFLFWPDSTEAQARTNLRRELHHLRRALPQADRYLHVSAQTLHWRVDGWCVLDVARFEDAVVRANRAEEAGDVAALRAGLEEAAAVYRGDLLPSCYDAWIDADRERLRQSRGAVLERLIDVLEAEGEYAAAIRHAEHLVRHDTLREASYARLIGLYAASGDRAGAVRTYRRCAAALTEELGVEPGPAATAAYRRALNMDAAPRIVASADAARAVPGGVALRPVRASDSPPLVGRERERAAIRDWIRRSAEGSAPGEILLLTGEQGIGKSRMLEEVAAEVRGAGGRVLRGRGFEAEMVRPYGAWVDALRSIHAEPDTRSGGVGSLIPEIVGASEAPTDRIRLFDAVADLLLRLAAGGAPVAVIVDDIQWLDEASAALLHYVARLLADAPVLLACAARPGEMEDNAPVLGLVRALRRERRLRTIELRPMDREQISELAHLVNEDVDGNRVFADSGGNPLFALEVARALADRDSGPSGSLEELIGNRLSRLDEPARELVSWAVALGRGFSASTLALVTGRPLPELLPALDRLERHGIIRPDDAAGGETAYDFAHDVVRQTAYRQLSGPRRRLVHLRIARALAECDDPDDALAGDVAHHAALGGDAALAAGASLTAGERCLRLFAYAEAAELARRGIEHCQALDHRTRVRLQMPLLQIYVTAGVPPEGVPAVEDEIRSLIAESRALGLVDEEAVGFMLISLLNYDRENFARVHEHSLRAAEAGRSASPATTARVLGHTGACLAAIEREMPRAEALLMEAQSLSDRVGIEVTDIPMGLGYVRHYTADRAEARRLLEAALRMARADQDHFRECQCLTYLTMLELEAGAFDSALARCAELAPVTAKLEEGSEHAFTTALDALARYGLRADGAEADLEEALKSLRALDARRKLAYVLTLAAEADLAGGRAATALGRAEEALDVARVADHRSGIALACAVLARSALAMGDGERAEDALSEVRREKEEMRAWSARARMAVEDLVYGGERQDTLAR